MACRRLKVRGWWIAAGLFGALASSADAQERGRRLLAQNEVDQLRARIGRETSPARVTPVEVRDLGMRIAPPEEVATEERAAPVIPRDSPDQPSPENAGGVLTNGTLDERLAQLRACPGELASERGTSPAQVRGRRLEVRWTVQPDGSTADVDTVAVENADPDLLACVERKVSEWRFDEAFGRTLSARFSIR
jgi:hypothetical protein